MNAPESIADIRKLLKNPTLFHEEAFINGAWVKASGNARFTVQNPASGQKIASVANLNSSDAEEAISAADMALPGQLRIKESKRTPLFNGPLECRLFKFEMHQKRPAIKQSGDE